jgi:competence protein ComEC
MPSGGEQDWGDGVRPHERKGLISTVLAAAARSLEAEADRWSLWTPVLFASGVLAYFALSSEPAPITAASLLIAALGLALAARGGVLGLAIGGAVLAFALGFADAKLRTEMTRAPVLANELHNAAVEGFVEAYERREKGRVRITLRVLRLGALKPEETPYRVRVTQSEKAGMAATGTAVAVKATLRPPPEPVMPNGFDFGRAAWFARLGGTGYATGKLESLDLDRVAPLDLRFWAAIDQVRNHINTRIAAALPGERGEIAAALITGERAGISDEVNQAMRNSGLFHILSISGLHMVIMAGTVFWLVRALLALVPALALSFPIRKWAAACALAAALGYLLLSGAAVPTVRSWVMMSIVLLAVLLDRPALTMRNVALTALLILVLEPETVFDPSFQMSFAAVIGLVALFESRSGRNETSAEDVSTASTIGCSPTATHATPRPRRSVSLSAATCLPASA